MDKLKELFNKYRDDIIKPVAVLLAICIVIPLALSLTNKVTATRIAELEEKNSRETIAGLIVADSFEEAEFKSGSDEFTYYAAIRDGETAGYIFTTSEKGYGGDVSAVSEVVHQKENDGYLKFFSLGVEGYDSKTLHQLCGEKVLKLNGYDFTGILDWAHKSMRAVSVSSPGEKVRLPALPENVDKDVNDWFD